MKHIWLLILLVSFHNTDSGLIYISPYEISAVSPGYYFHGDPIIQEFCTNITLKSGTSTCVLESQEYVVSILRKYK